MCHRTPHSLHHSISLADLRPTQMTVGFQEVARKRCNWKRRHPDDRSSYLKAHPVPVVIGPDGIWMIDRHHLVRMLHEEGLEEIGVEIVTDLSHCTSDAFLSFMERRSWFHLFDEKGQRQSRGTIPRHVTGLRDDPYRSLAGAVRRRGGYVKVDMPHAECRWASFLREHVTRPMCADHYENCLEEAVAIARSQDAAHLPGWTGCSLAKPRAPKSAIDTDLHPN
jgi:hypothetical protein